MIRASIISNATEAEGSGESQKLEQEQDQNARHTSQWSRSTMLPYDFPKKIIRELIERVIMQAQAVSGDTLVNDSADTKDKMLDDGAGKLDSEWVGETHSGQPGNVAEDRSKTQSENKIWGEPPAKRAKVLKPKGRIMKSRRGISNSPSPPESIPYFVHPGLGPKWDQPVIYPPTGRRRAQVDFVNLRRLDDGVFLNDNLINFYMNWAYIHANLPPNKVYLFNTHFYSSLSKPQKGQRGINYSAVQRWTVQEDIFNYDYAVVPINEDDHWYVVIICNLTNINRDSILGSYAPDVIDGSFDRDEPEDLSLIQYDPDEPIIIVLDSLGATHPRTVRHLKDYVLEEGKAKRKIDAVIDKSMNPKDIIPLQNNFRDCGPFLLGYLDKFFVNPREFITKILTREMSVETDWPDLDPKYMRNHIRDLLFELAKEQQAERRRLELEKCEKKEENVEVRSLEGTTGVATCVPKKLRRSVDQTLDADEKDNPPRAPRPQRQRQAPAYLEDYVL